MVARLNKIFRFVFLLTLTVLMFAGRQVWAMEGAGGAAAAAPAAAPDTGALHDELARLDVDIPALRLDIEHQRDDIARKQPGLQGQIDSKAAKASNIVELDSQMVAKEKELDTLNALVSKLAAAPRREERAAKDTRERDLGANTRQVAGAIEELDRLQLRRDGLAAEVEGLSRALADFEKLEPALDAAEKSLSAKKARRSVVNRKILDLEEGPKTAEFLAEKEGKFRSVAQTLTDIAKSEHKRTEDREAAAGELVALTELKARKDKLLAEKRLLEVPAVVAGGAAAGGAAAAGVPAGGAAAAAAPAPAGPEAIAANEKALEDLDEAIRGALIDRGYAADAPIDDAVDKAQERVTRLLPRGMSVDDQAKRKEKDARRRPAMMLLDKQYEAFKNTITLAAELLTEDAAWLVAAANVAKYELASLGECNESAVAAEVRLGGRVSKLLADDKAADAATAVETFAGILRGSVDPVRLKFVSSHHELSIAGESYAKMEDLLEKFDAIYLDASQIAVAHGQLHINEMRSNELSKNASIATSDTTASPALKREVDELKAQLPPLNEELEKQKTALGTVTKATSSLTAQRELLAADVERLSVKNTQISTGSAFDAVRLVEASALSELSRRVAGQLEAIVRQTRKEAEEKRLLAVRAEEERKAAALLQEKERKETTAREEKERKASAERAEEEEYGISALLAVMHVDQSSELAPAFTSFIAFAKANKLTEAAPALAGALASLIVDVRVDHVGVFETQWLAAAALTEKTAKDVIAGDGPLSTVAAFLLSLGSVSVSSGDTVPWIEAIGAFVLQKPLWEANPTTSTTNHVCLSVDSGDVKRSIDIWLEPNWKYGACTVSQQVDLMVAVMGINKVFASIDAEDIFDVFGSVKWYADKNLRSAEAAPSETPSASTWGFARLLSKMPIIGRLVATETPTNVEKTPSNVEEVAGEAAESSSAGEAAGAMPSAEAAKKLEEDRLEKEEEAAKTSSVPSSVPSGVGLSVAGASGSMSPSGVAATSGGFASSGGSSAAAYSNAPLSDEELTDLGCDRGWIKGWAEQGEKRPAFLRKEIATDRDALTNKIRAADAAVSSGKKANVKSALEVLYVQDQEK